MNPYKGCEGLRCRLPGKTWRNSFPRTGTESLDQQKRPAHPEVASQAAGSFAGQQEGPPTPMPPALPRGLTGPKHISLQTAAPFPGAL